MKPKLSICMMVKNEASNLPRCLDSLQELMAAVPSELIIVDTGSTDDTVAIALEYTDKVFFHPWNNNFSEMRNITIKYAAGQWIFIIDADEELLKADGLIRFLQAKQAANVGGAGLTVHNFTSEQAYVLISSMRLFRNTGRFHYKGVIHNTPQAEGVFAATDSVLAHYGYISDDKELMERKFQRTSTLLRQELAKRPDDIYYRFQLSVSYSMHGDKEESLEEIEKAYETIRRCGHAPAEYIYIYCQYAKAALAVGHVKKAEEICREGIALEAEYIDLYYFLGQALALQGKLAEAIPPYEKFLELVAGFDNLRIKYNPFINHHTIFAKDEVIHNLAVMYYKTGDDKKALDRIAILLRQDPAMAEQNLVLLAELAFRLSDFTLLKEVYLRLTDLDRADLLAVLTDKIEQGKDVANIRQFREFSGAFAAIDGPYGELSRLRHSCQKMNADELAAAIRQFTASWNLNALPDYYLDVVFYSLTVGGLTADVVAGLSEDNALRALQYLGGNYRCPLIDHLRKWSFAVGDFRTVKANRLFLKYLLFSGDLDDREYDRYFRLYVANGAKYMEYLYNPAIIDGECIYDVKNVEEAFLLYMTLAEKEPRNSKRYVELLKRASEVYPDMGKGVRGLLRDLQSKDSGDEFQQLKRELLNQVRALIGRNDLAAARQIVTEAEKIVGPDLELLALKTQIETNNRH